MKNKKTLEEVVAILKERGIELTLGGCGCCESPWFSVTIDGEEVYDDVGVRI